MRWPRFTIRSIMIAIAFAALMTWWGIRLSSVKGPIRLIGIANLGIFVISGVTLVLLNRRE